MAQMASGGQTSTETVENDPYASFRLYEHQRRAVAKLEARNGNAPLLMQMRTGKTRTALAYLHNRAKRILVVCPLGAFGVWEQEIASLPPYASYVLLVLHDRLSLKQRAERLRKAAAACEYLLVITNYEAYWREPLRSAITAWGPEAVVPDEAHKLNNRTARQTRYAHLLSDRPTTRYRIPLTGTPITKGLENLFSLYRFTDTAVFGKNWPNFAQLFLKMGGFQGRQIVGYQNEALAERLVEETAFRITRDECFDIPPSQHMIVPVRLNESTAKTYEDMRVDGLSKVSGTDSSGRAVEGLTLAQIVLTSLLRLQQITSGFVKTNENDEVDISHEKLNACADLIDTALSNDERSVVFCRFVRDVHRVRAKLEALGARVGVLEGSVKTEDRTRLIDSFKAGKLDVIVAQIKVASLSIDLADATVCVYFSTGFSLDEFQQGRDRLQGPRQTKSCGYYYLQGVLPDGKDTVDAKIYRALDERIRIAHALLRDPGMAKSLLS